MPAFGNLVVNDGQATPAPHTFAPVTVSGDLASFADRSSGIPVGYGKITISLREPIAPANVYKVGIKIWIPTLEQTSASTATGIQPAPTVAYTTLCSMEFLMPARGTLANRKDILAYAKNVLAHSTVSSVLENLENVY